MKNKKRLLLLLLVLSFSLSAQEGKSIKKEIDLLVAPLVETNNYSGSIMVSRNDSILFQNSYGEMSREYNLKNQPDTKFFLASVSMIFTSAAILKLYEEGKLDLNDTLDKHLPWYKEASKITIHQMLSQRSGIPAIGRENNVDYDSITKFTHDTKALMDYFKEYDLLFNPGSKYNHGRSEYILLAHLIEKLSNKSFGTYLRDEIFEPLGMENSGHFNSEKEIIQNLAKGYAPKDIYDVESAYQIDWSSKTGHASIYSTVSDLQKFAKAILDKKLLSANSWKQILTDHGNNVGYGWFIRDHLNKKRYQMNGRSPGFSSYLAIYPEEGLIVVVLSNNYISLPSNIGMSIAAIIFNEPYQSLNLSRDKLEGYLSKSLVGNYQFDADFYVPNHKLEIKEKEGRLFCEWGPFIPVHDGTSKTLKYIIRTFWSTIEFVENEKGNIVTMMFDEHKGVKID
ncbi:serine hydrolase domain-containing protein [Flagellimonas meishanensis]|uniref:serine hydrolase domain-containing protein n=1 Tax=Flagellimonas meishanensis TaxID=2873264 RepID=UPI001CA6FC87|nr:serine hydrolase domain-containing protein [[Muricauda] meishanensis]